jgi:hypothetical protein
MPVKYSRLAVSGIAASSQYEEIKTYYALGTRWF